MVVFKYVIVISFVADNLVCEDELLGELSYSKQRSLPAKLALVIICNLSRRNNWLYQALVTFGKLPDIKQGCLFIAELFRFSKQIKLGGQYFLFKEKLVYK